MDVAAATWNLQPRQNLQRQRARERLGEACAGWRPACAWERPRKLFVRSGAPAAAAHELSAVDAGMDGWIIPLMTDGGTKSDGVHTVPTRGVNARGQGKKNPLEPWRFA